MDEPDERRLAGKLGLRWGIKRLIKTQLLGTTSPEDARRSLADIAWLNRWMGGHMVIRKMLSETVKPCEAFSLLDVGAASGDSGRGILKSFPGAPRVVGDAFALPFTDGGFDYVFSSLFLHHFSEAEAVTLLREFGRVAKRGVMVCDVERHWLALWFLPLTRWLFRWHWVTMHDGPVSVRSAFTAGELAGLGREAGLKDLAVRRHRPAFRLTMFGAVD